MTGEKPDIKAFAETKRDPVALADMKAAMRQIMSRPEKPEPKSENRTPTKAELNQRWKLTRR